MTARTSRRRRRPLTLGTVIVVVLAVAVSVYIAAERQPGPADAAGGSELSDTILALPSASGWHDGYERDRFGDGWIDVDRNGCDTRNDILARDLTATTFKPGTHDCVVLSGELDDPYTGAPIGFVRGDRTSELVQIDHIVPLSWAWGHGASEWSEAEREAFANDPANLLAVDGPTNSAKSDSGPAEWAPPDESFHCAYAESFTRVLSSYDLPIGTADRQALLLLAGRC